MSWKLVGAVIVAAMFAGCGSCQKPPPDTEAPAAHGAAKAGAPTRARAPMEAPTARELPTIGPAPEVRPLTPGAPAKPPAAPPRDAESEPAEDEEADCSVLADAEPDYGPPPLTVQFSVEYECTEGAATVSWDFGDGSAPSSETSPAHTYNTAGDYVAIVTVRTPDGLYTTDEIDITVEEDEVEE